MKEGRESLRNSKCTGQLRASGNVSRSSFYLFKRQQNRISSYSKPTLGIHPSISRNLVSFGRLGLASVIEHQPLKKVKILYGSGSVITTNMNESSKKGVNNQNRNQQPASCRVWPYNNTNCHCEEPFGRVNPERSEGLRIDYATKQSNQIPHCSFDSAQDRVRNDNLWDCFGITRSKRLLTHQETPARLIASSSVSKSEESS